MGFEFKLPDIGEGVVEGEIVKWLVTSGDQVEVDQPMVEVMTDKATVVIPSPRAGTVAELRGAEGDVVAVGAVLVVLESTSAESAAPSPSTEAAAAPAPSPAPAAERTPVLAAPATRRLARELGVDLSTVAASGPAGRVTSEDVRAAAAPPQRTAVAAGPSPVPRMDAENPAPVALRQQGSGDVLVPVRGLRRKIWDAMTRSAFTAPHFTFVEACDLTELVGFRARLNRFTDAESPRLTYLPFILKALGVALREFPALNGQVNEAEQSFLQRSDLHIGVAVASDRGLVVPVLRHANRRSLADLARELHRLSSAVRDNSLAPGDLGGSTFTVTSLGRDGGLMATPIINHPEVAILGVHRLEKRPVVNEDDEIVVRHMMNLSLSCDHRLIDGHVAARFTYRVIELLERPDRLVLEMD